MRSNTRWFGLMFLTVLSCHRHHSAVMDKNADQTISHYFDAQVQQPLPIVELADARPEDTFELQSARIVGDTLLVDVAFSGGCKEHSFEMSTNKQWLKSLPPQINLNLIHRANSDDCRSMLMGTLRFDLTSIRHPQSRSIQIIINQDSNQKILYTY